MISDSRAARQPRKDVVDQCIWIIQEGSSKERYAILPKISIIRDERFLKPLLRVLKAGSRKDMEFAALALGTLGRAESLEVLYLTLANARNHRGQGTQSLQTAIIVAMGEIGKDSAVSYLRKAMAFTIEGDTFLKQRQKLILSAIGCIAQQGGQRALEFLKEYLFSDECYMRAHALSELSVAYWHRPNEIPEDVLATLLRLTQDGCDEVRSAAIASVASLADLGCKRVKKYFQNLPG
ncbi:MAG: hypothetical protein HY644_07025 [Acidobacteria bacterium]|nr:hypothetical protein [Acidobacteriota bacterium]